jgi:membrane protease YdiL (CAAX protease family)
MPPPDAANALDAILGTLVRLAIIACAAVWTMMIVRWRRGQPVLPYEPRRPVPWKGLDVAFVAVLFICGSVLPVLALQTSRAWFGVPAVAAPQADEQASPHTEHPLATVLRESHSIWAIAVCVVSAIIVAPLTEEFIFRLVLQGWLESLERRLRRRIYLLRRITAGLAPIGAVALLFAAMHFREAAKQVNVNVVVFVLGASSLASLLTIAISVGWLRFSAGATLADFGIVPGKLAVDFRIGDLALLAVLAPVLAIMRVVSQLLPESVVADPIPIFFLAIALGILYYRTHRIVPSLVLHMLFNTVGVLVALAGAK